MALGWQCVCAVDASPSVAYPPRDGTTTVLHGVVRDHLEEFLALATRHGDGTGLPPFVEQELRRFLGCGVLAHGFARVRCDGCGFERLVPFSCKGRGFCPSCGGRRMAERAAHLTDRVLPSVPLRQWVCEKSRVEPVRPACSDTSCWDRLACQRPPALGRG